MSTEQSHKDTEVVAFLVKNLPDWTFEAGCLQRTYRTGGWKATMMVANVIGHLAEAAWHHPEVNLSYAAVQVRLSTHSANGITDKDFALAQKIEQVVGWQPGKEGGALEGTPNGDERYTYIKYDK